MRGEKEISRNLGIRLLRNIRENKFSFLNLKMKSLDLDVGMTGWLVHSIIDLGLGSRI